MLHKLTPSSSQSNRNDYISPYIHAILILRKFQRSNCYFKFVNIGYGFLRLSSSSEFQTLGDKYTYFGVAINKSILVSHLVCFEYSQPNGAHMCTSLSMTPYEDSSISLETKHRAIWYQ